MGLRQWWVIALLSSGFLAACYSADPVQVLASGLDSADTTEIVEILVGLPPSRHNNPLAAMKGRAALYGKYHGAATTGNPSDIRVYLLLAFTSMVRMDAATAESFSSDLLPVYRQQPDEILTALKDNPWLVDSVCYFLGKGFVFADRDAKDRAAFTGSEAKRIRSALHERSASRCLEQIAKPQRPGR